MANISLEDPNFVYLDNYFYTIDDALQLLLKVCFDGTLAYCYTLDTPVSGQIQSLEYDGINFWSLERGTGRIIIRKWKLIGLVCTQQAKFEYITTVSETIDSYCFTLENYQTAFGANEVVGQTVLTLAAGGGLRMESGVHVILGPNSSGQSEERIVDSASLDTVTLTVATDYGYAADDLIRYHKSGYFLNNYDGIDSSKGSLYKVDLLTGSVQHREPGVQFKDVESCTFGTIQNRSGGGVVDSTGDGNNNVIDAVMFIKGPLLFFVDIYSGTYSLFGSAVMDIMGGGSPDTIKDLTLDGSTIYMLKSGFDYQAAQFDIFVNSISVMSYPAILPADGFSTSAITASVLDQYNNPWNNKTVYFALTGGGSLSLPSNITNSAGIAAITYTASSTVETITITSTVHQT